MKLKRFRIVFLVCACLIVSACAALPTPAPLPATQWLRVEVDPALSNQADLFARCTPAGVGLVVQHAPGASFAQEQADLFLSWGQPSDESFPGYAAELASDDLVVVVNAQNAVTSIQVSALHLLYTGQLPEWNWDYLGQPAAPLTAYAYPPASALHTIVASGLLAEGQGIDRNVALVPGPREMLDSIAQDPGGIGFLPQRWVDEQVKVLAIDGAAPETWTQPILSLSGQEPGGAALQWVICVQDGLR